MSIKLRRNLALLCLALLPAQAPFAAPYAYLTDGSNGDTVRVLDTATDTVVASIPMATGSTPWGVAVSRDQARAYVSLVDAGALAVFDAASHVQIGTVAVGPAPFSVAVSDDGTRVYAPSLVDGTLSIVDAASLALLATVPLGAGGLPFGVAVNPAGNRVYVANSGTDTVAIVDAANHTLIASVPVGSNPRGVAVHPDGSRVYATNRLGDTVSVIDAGSQSVVATIPVGEHPNGIAIDNAGSRAYVANQFGTSISVIDMASDTVVATVALGAGEPYGVAITPDDTRLYVGDISADRVWAVDTASLAVAATLPIRANATFGRFIAPGAGGEPPRTGSVRISKAIDGGPAGAADLLFNFTVACDTVPGSGDGFVGASANAPTQVIDIPLPANCVVVELGPGNVLGAPFPDAPDGWTWAALPAPASVQLTASTPTANVTMRNRLVQAGAPADPRPVPLDSRWALAILMLLVMLGAGWMIRR